MSVVLDASAALALLFGGNGADVVERAAEGSFLSTANLTEVLEKAGEVGAPHGVTIRRLSDLRVSTIPSDAEQARLAAELKPLVASS